MYACMYVCIYLCMHACMHVCMYIHTERNTCIHVCICICIHVHTCICMYVHVCVCVCVRVCVCASASCTRATGLEVSARQSSACACARTRAIPRTRRAGSGGRNTYYLRSPAPQRGQLVQQQHPALLRAPCAGSAFILFRPRALHMPASTCRTGSSILRATFPRWSAWSVSAPPVVAVAPRLLCGGRESARVHVCMRAQIRTHTHNQLHHNACGRAQWRRHTQFHASVAVCYMQTHTVRAASKEHAPGHW